jgi:glycosyl hydrolase family 123/concanavalin A-like lectin/glucanase superfamily protein
MNYSKLLVVLLFLGTVSCFAVDKNIITSWSFDVLKNGAIKDNTGKHNAVFAKSNKRKKIFAKGLQGSAIKMHDGKNLLVIKHNDDLDLIDDFTIKCTFKADKLSTYRTLFWKGNRSVKPQRINYYLSLHNGKVEFKFKDTTGKWFVFATKKPVVEIDKWYQVIVTFDKGKVTIYLDCKNVFSGIYKTAKLCPNKYPLYIGAGQTYDGAGIGYPFNGLIDSVVIMKGIHPPTITGKEEIIKLKKKFKTAFNVELKAKKKIIISKIIAEPLWLKKNTRQQLQTMSIQELESIAKTYQYKSFFNSISAKSLFLVTTLNTSERIVSPENIVNGKIKILNTIDLSAAKNEYEGFQIILLGNPNKNIDDIKIKLNSLISKDGKTTIPANQLEWGYIKTIRSHVPQYDVAFVGEIPDVIMEGQTQSVKVKSSWFTPVYIRIRVKDTVPAGIYSGKVIVSCNNESRNVNVNLKVYNFKLPNTTSLKIVFSFFEGFYQKWYGYKKMTNEQKMYIYNFLLKYRILPNNIYTNKLYPAIKFLKKLKKSGNQFCTIGSYSGKKLLTEEQLDKLMLSYRRKVEKLKENDMLSDVWFYGYDELAAHSKGLDAAKQFMTRFKKEFPYIKTIQTSFPYKNIEPYFNVWCPLVSFYKIRAKRLEKIRQKGNELWWYNADGPKKPYPNYFLDYPVFDCRIIMTLSYMYNVKGILYWCINREWSTNYDIKKNWPEKRWKPYIFNVFTKARQFKNGMGNFVYPGKNGKMLPSLRLENLRDGIEDYEYLTLLKKLVAKAKKQDGNTALVKQAETLLKIPVKVAFAVDNYSANPNNLIKYRNDVALMIEKINQ